MTFLLAAGAAAGFLDSIVGGGGLITVPALMLELGITPAAVGTNKIAGSAATLAAIAVYGSKGRVPWAAALRFGVVVALGSVAGAAASPCYLAPFYPVFLWAGTALCLGALAFRGRWTSRPSAPEAGAVAVPAAALAAGFVVGLYDGAWGPGGGTFMFLALLYLTPLGLVGSMAAAKVANFLSAFSSLGAYAWQGVVAWKLGILFAGSLAGGAVLGASVALKHAERVLVPLLLVVAALLLGKLLV